MKIKASKNFAFAEFGCGCGKCQYTGGLQISMQLVEKIQKLRTAYGWPLHINSAIRCEKHNKSVDGRPGSMHLPAQGALACDIWMKDRKGRILLVKTGLELGLSVGVYKTFLHLDDRKHQIIWGA